MRYSSAFCFLLLAVFIAACTPTPTVTLAIPENPKPPIQTIDDRKTSTGFYWPTDAQDPKTIKGWSNNWNYDGCSGNNLYFQNKYHIGMDIPDITEKKGGNVYAIADGTIIGISKDRVDPVTGKLHESGWGTGNMAFLVDHQLNDEEKSHFTAVYGHIKIDPNSELQNGKRKTIEAGEAIGKMGLYLNGYHLHLGIHPGAAKTLPGSNLGAMPCPITDTNGFADPYEWLTTKVPGKLSINPTPVPPTPKPSTSPTGRPYAPDGHWLAFMGPDENIWLVKDDGTGLKKVTADGKVGPGTWDPDVSYRYLRWSPDGTMLAAMRIDRQGSQIQVFRMPDLTATTIVTNTQGEFDWSPDSQGILFSNVPYESMNARGKKPGGLSYINIQTKQQKVFIETNPSVRLVKPNWSMKGDSIYFGIEPAPWPDVIWGEEIGFTTAAGGTYSSIANTPQCSWSPDGRLACRLGTGEILCGGISIFTNRGKKLADLPFLHSCYRALDPAWSPDGNWIAFSGENNKKQDIYLIKPDGSQLTNLTKQSADRNSKPVWSPDTKKLAYLTGNSGKKDIVIIDIATKSVRKITKAAGNYDYLSWQPAFETRPITPKVETQVPTSPAVNLRDPESIVYWFTYGLVNQKIEPIIEIMNEETVMYGTGLASGRSEITKDELIKYIADRLSSHPTCAGYDINGEKTMIIIWTDKWQPPWEYQGRAASRSITFHLFLANGKVSVWAYFTPSPSILDVPSVNHKPCPK